MPDLRPFLILGLAVGGVFALSGVGMVVLFRATGVLNLAYGAVGACGALIAWSMINVLALPNWLAYLVAIAFGGVVTLIYGSIFGPRLAERDPLVKAIATLGLTLILLGIMSWGWSYEAHSLVLPTTAIGFTLGGVRVNLTQILALGLGIFVTLFTAAFLRYTKLGVAMRSLANHRETTAMLGVPVRQVEAAAWLGTGLLSGATGLLLATLVGLDIVGLTFLVIASLAAALMGQLRSLTITMLAGLAIGIVQSCLTGFAAISSYRTLTPFIFAIVALLWFGFGRGTRLSNG
ncbi:MAG: branched-chain amino acid ABC transporter permease [Chloroflexi bacterium]|nr:branched-chain amino acid ABC transporter permease [Chloroflexota bacterium]